MSRTNQTKLLLAQSLQQLMVTSPLEKISVNDIVEQAGVGRNTFYYHFEDKYDLVNWYFQTGATRFLLEQTRTNDWPSLLTGVEDYFRENRTFYKNALSYSGQNSLQEYIFDYVRAIFAQRAREHTPTMSQADLNFVSNMLAGAFMGVLVPWVHGGMKESIRDCVVSTSHLYDDNLIQLLFGNKG